MNPNWGYQTFNSYVQNPQGLTYSQDKQKPRTRAYINPLIINYEYIKRFASRELMPSVPKIHVNPNFKDLNCLLKKDASLLSNSSSTQVAAGSAISEKNQFNDKVNVFRETNTYNSKSRFKKINNHSVKNVYSSQYIWKKEISKDNLNNYKKEESSQFTSYKITTPRKVQKLINSTNSNKKSPPIYKSKTKIINKCKTKLINNYKLETKQTKPQSPAKYKLNNLKIINNRNIKSHSVKVASLVRNKYKYFKTAPTRQSRYKIDKRKKSVNKKPKSNIDKIQDITKLFPKNFCSRLKPHFYNTFAKSKFFKENFHSWRKENKTKEVEVRKINHFPNKRVIKIGGILYKSTTNKLTLATKGPKDTKNLISPTAKVKRNHIVYVRGEKFILNKNGKTLRKQTENKKKKSTATPKRIDIGGVTYIKKSQNVLVRTNVHQARYLVNKAKNKSIALLTNLHKRSSMPCMIFHKLGRCIRHNKGLCMYKHDPKNIALCKKFLKGNCNDEKCLLSHDVIQEKMATCYFFLNGNCERENCPFLHVKLGKNAEICEKFLQGFCNLGKDCSKRHSHICPEFDKKGTCSQGTKCLYPHKTKKDKIKETTENVLYNKTFFGPFANKKQVKKKRSLIKSEDKEKDPKKPKKMKKRPHAVENLEQDKDLIQCVPKRIKLEELPCFIPLKSEP